MTANGYTGSSGGGGGGSTAWTDITGKPATFPPTIGSTSTTAVAGNDSRLTDARTPTAHASSHGSAGSDAVSLNASQISAGTLALARVPTGTTSATVALGDAPASAASAAVTAHLAVADPHPQYLTAAEGNAAYQPLDADLTTIAGLTATTDNVMMGASSAWASRTPAQARTALTLLPSILLGPVDAIPGGTPANTLVIRTT